MYGHYHLHHESGKCYGDFEEFDDAAQAAEHNYPWITPDNEPISDILIVVDAPVCMYDCREN